MSGLNGFTLDEYDSVNFGIIMTQPPPEVTAERDVEVISIPGRSGDLIRDNGRYRNVQIPFKCAILPDTEETLRDAVLRAMPLLAPEAGYRRLVTTYEPNHFRLARVASAITVESIVEQAGTFQVTMDCNPQRFLMSGERTIDFAAAGSLRNDHFPSLPLITVYGSGDGTVTVGDTVVSIVGQTDAITLDCDLQNAYHETAEGIRENRNGYIRASSFPQLQPGENVIGWTGGVERLEIIPRWWTL